MNHLTTLREVRDLADAIATKKPTIMHGAAGQEVLVYCPGDNPVLAAQVIRTNLSRLISEVEAAEPVAWHVCSYNKDGTLSLEHAAAWQEAAHEHINDAITEHGIEEAASWVVRPVYTHPTPTGLNAATAAADGFRDGVASVAQYPLPADLYDSKDWKAGTYAERVEWLHTMYENKKKELAAYLSAPTSEAWLPPLSPNDHPDPHSFKWSESEMRAIQSYAREAVAQAVEREREACAISCEVNAARWVEEPGTKKWYAAHECAAAIRARGQGGAA